MDLLLASLDTAGEVFLPDVLFCLKCVLAPFVLGCVRACVRACVRVVCDGMGRSTAGRKLVNPGLIDLHWSHTSLSIDTRSGSVELIKAARITQGNRLSAQVSQCFPRSALNSIHTAPPQL